MICAKFCWNWPSGSGEDDFSNLLMYFRNFVIISPWPFIWTKLNPLHPLGRILCAKFGWNMPSGSGEEDLLKLSMYFQFHNYLPLEKNWPFTWTNLNPFTQGLIMPSLVEIGPVVLEKKIFWNLSMYFSLICNHLPLEKSGALHLNKLESPSPKDDLCQVWLKLAQWFWRRWKCD